MKTNCIVLLLLFFGAISSAQAQQLKPKWLHQQVFVGNNCDFIIAHSSGETNIANARMAALVDLREKLQHTDVVSISQELTGTSHDIFIVENGITTSSTHQKDDGWIKIKVDGAAKNIDSRKIDEWVVQKRDGIDYYALVAIPGKGSNVDLSRLSPTENYASDPANWGLMLIPGAAQMYKGSYLKGGLIMGGAVLLAGGIVTFESLRSDYLAKITTTHSAENKKAYNDRANGMAIGRNICIGTAAALYVYNIIDALVAPGARRIIVTPSATPTGEYGMAVRYNF